MLLNYAMTQQLLISSVKFQLNWDYLSRAIGSCRRQK